MSDEKETELVTGTIGGVTLKREGTWTVAVLPDGSQYSKNLWTKDSELVESLSKRLGEHGAFVCNASYWKRQDGQQVRSLWISSDDPETHTPVERPQTAPAATRGPADGMTPEKWDAKERRDYRSRAWAQILGAFSHTIKIDEDPVAVFNRLQPLHRKVFEDVCGSFAYPSDDSDVPFG